jgi:hypothetical protein
MATGLGGAIGLFGTGVQDLFTAQGDRAAAAGYQQAAQSYQTAAGIATANIGIEQNSVAIQQAQLDRKIEMTTGSATAAEGAANVSGGSAGDIMRMSMQQGALAKGIVSTQGQIQENAFAEQATAYQAMSASAIGAAGAASAAAKGATAGGIFSFIGGAVGLLALL